MKGSYSPQPRNFTDRIKAIMNTKYLNKQLVTRYKCHWRSLKIKYSRRRNFEASFNGVLNGKN